MWPPARLLLADGMETGEIARRTGKSPSAVRSQLASARRRVGVPSTLQLVLACIRYGWVRAPALGPADELVWRLRLEARLLEATGILREIADSGLSPSARAYLAAFDEWLASRHWDEAGCPEARARARGLVAEILQSKKKGNQR